MQHENNHFCPIIIDLSDRLSPRGDRRHSNLLLAAQLYYSLLKPESSEIKVLAFMMEFGESGFYNTPRKLCCEKLSITPKQYRRAIGLLLNTGLIKQFKDEDNGCRVRYYILNLNLIKVLKKANDLVILIKF